MPVADWPAMTGGGGALRRFGVALVLAAAICACPAARADTGSLEPRATVPEVASESPGQYYILLLKWSRDLVMGAVKARVTYLDPPLYLAWLRQTDPNIDQGAFEQKLDGFPKTLRFRVAYQATERGAIHAKEWKATLLTPDGTAIPASAGKRIAPVDLKSGADGDTWEDVWDYQFKAPDAFLKSASQGFSIALAGPAGKGTAAWAFGAAESASAPADGYVVYLGAALSALSAALLVALYVTRPPRQTLA